jgi:hypothetical protein
MLTCIYKLFNISVIKFLTRRFGHSDHLPTKKRGKKMMALISLEDILYFEISVLGDVSRVSDSVERFLVAMETLGRPDLLDSLPSLLPWQ